ncbi:hypothetical protein B7L09_02310 [Pseudomonas mandelii]|nr:hypothetical protein B7L09_02310 [Pseudomonas mandelii]
MGAGLPAMAECHSTYILNVQPSSRASPLPQGFLAAHRICIGLTAALICRHSNKNKAHLAQCRKKTPSPFNWCAKPCCKVAPQEPPPTRY